DHQVDEPLRRVRYRRVPIGPLVVTDVRLDAWRRDEHAAVAAHVDTFCNLTRRGLDPHITAGMGEYSVHGSPRADGHQSSWHCTVLVLKRLEIGGAVDIVSLDGVRLDVEDSVCLAGGDADVG